MSVYVGIDVHRKRSQVAVIDQSGEVLANRNVPNGTEPILGVIGGLPPGTPAAFEAAFGWGWLVELLEDYGFAPHLVHPLQCKAIASARLKNDKGRRGDLGSAAPRRRCASCGRCCATGRSWCGCGRCCATGSTRSWPATATTGLRAAGAGRAWLASLRLPAVSREVIQDDLALTGAPQVPIDRLDLEVHQRARSDPRVKVLTRLPGAGPFTALVILAEAGDITRFGSARKLAAWAGLTPTVRDSDRTVRHGHIPKQGSAWLRWILCEAAQTAKRSPQFAASYQELARRRGKKIATTAIARKLLTRAWHLLTEAEHAAAGRQAAISPPAA